MEKLHHVYRLLVLAVVLFSVGCSPKEGADQQEEARQLVAKQFEQWQKGEANFFDLLHEDVVWEVSGRSPLSGIYRGKKEFMNRAVSPITSQLATRIAPELISISADENWVWLHWKGKATAKNGSSYENQYLWKIVVEGGKITQAVAFLDTYELDLLMRNKKKL